MYSDHDRFSVEKRIFHRPWMRILALFIRNKSARGAFKEIVRTIRREGYRYREIIIKLRREK